MRYNIFNTAHLPLKNALLTGCIALTNSIDNSPSSVAEAVQKVEEVLQIHSEQVTYESLHILPFIFDYEPSIWNNYASEHDSAARLAKKLKGLVQSWQRQQNAADKLQIASMVMESYNEFMLFNFNHMDDEEATLNEILWRYYPDNVLRQIEEKMDILPHLVQAEETTSLQMATAA